VGRLSRIKELFNRQLPAYTDGNPIFRGIAFPIDDFLRGKVRFAKKIGAFLPIYVPNNSFKLTRIITPPVEQIFVDTIIPGLRINSLISIADRELAKVEDFDDSAGVISLTDKVRASYIEGTRITLFAVPIFSNGANLSGATTITIRSEFIVLPGDELIIQVGSLIEAFETISIATSTQTGTSGSDLLYTVTLNTALPKDFVDDDELLLRAHPAYQSEQILLPTSQTSGPFLYDYVSGALIDSAFPISEVLTVELLDIAGNTLIGPSTSPKNTLVARLPVRNDMFLFWDILEGRINYDGSQNKTILITNDLGRASIIQHTIPNIDPDNTWLAGFVADKDCTVLVQFGDDNTPTSIPLIAGILNTSSVGVPLGDASAEYINVSVIGDPNTVVHCSDWTVEGIRISKIKYSVVAQVSGFYTWASTGLILKPMFLNLDQVTAVNDFSTFNNGGISL